MFWCRTMEWSGNCPTHWLLYLAKSLRIGNTSKSVAQAHLWQVTPVDTDSSCTRSAFSPAFYSSAHIAPAILLAKLALSVRLYPAFIHFSTPRYHCARAFI